MKNVNVSISLYYAPVETVRSVSDAVERTTAEILELQKAEIIAACDRFFPQGYKAADNANLIKLSFADGGINLINHNGDFICFVGYVEPGFNFPDGYSRAHYNSTVNFKFRAFDGKTTRD
ncbi:hypothetical protein FDJ47_gp24 [Enterobacter phage Ec_L1]|uniref:Uncharacterized protein n=1 Tax=Enterobacter phage Ec_L1 TaxID=2070180 RepID=A0A2P0W9U5_9CAUD|nr:hypothetical protein FDJ47_gp24 [Enterobacter phage Ec_L1]AUV57138.1 hypothetical protein Ec24 [Enterobacter phage Ec_L1]